VSLRSIYNLFMVEFNLLIINHCLVLDLISALPFLLGSPIEPPLIKYILKEVDLSRKLPD
jgi:hypothetical protein